MHSDLLPSQVLNSDLSSKCSDLASYLLITNYSKNKNRLSSIIPGTRALHSLVKDSTLPISTLATEFGYDVQF